MACPNRLAPHLTSTIDGIAIRPALRHTVVCCEHFDGPVAIPWLECRRDDGCTHRPPRIDAVARPYYPTPCGPAARHLMPPRKRHVNPGDIEHRGRVTLRTDPTTVPRKPSGDSRPPASGHAREQPSPPRASSRYTPPITIVRIRAGWHKIVGFGLILLGLVVIVLNDVGRSGSAGLLPGGHSELYLILGLAISGYSMWWFGWFDREK